MVIFELVRAVLDAALGLDGRIVGGLAAVVVGVYYSREIAGFLGRAASLISIVALVLGGVGIALLVAIGAGVVTVDNGLVGSLLRALGGFLSGMH
jgi:hypothetical protein